MLVRTESMGKWDTLTHELSLFIPLAIIIVLSACYDSVPGIAAGLATYGFFRLWVAIKQCGSVPVLQSAIRKLRAKCQQAAGADPAGRGPEQP